MAEPTRAELERAVIEAIDDVPLGTIEQWNDMGPSSVLGALGRAACALRKVPADPAEASVERRLLKACANAKFTSRGKLGAGSQLEIEALIAELHRERAGRHG
jgi:hypothetical protein